MGERWLLPADDAWPVVAGAAVGLLVVALVRAASGRARRAGGALAWAATAIAGAAAGASVGVLTVWMLDGLPVRELYVSPGSGVQFLTNEQFHRIIVLPRWARVSALLALVSGAIAAWAWRRTVMRRR